MWAIPPYLWLGLVLDTWVFRVAPSWHHQVLGLSSKRNKLSLQMQYSFLLLFYLDSLFLHESVLVLWYLWRSGLSIWWWQRPFVFNICMPLGILCMCGKHCHFSSYVFGWSSFWSTHITQVGTLQKQSVLLTPECLSSLLWPKVVLDLLVHHVTERVSLELLEWMGRSLTGSVSVYSALLETFSHPC